MKYLYIFTFIICGLFAISDHVQADGVLLLLLFLMAVSIYLYFNQTKNQ